MTVEDEIIIMKEKLKAIFEENVDISDENWYKLLKINNMIFDLALDELKSRVK